MYNVAVIGTGNIAPAHIKGLLEFPNKCKIVALVDIYIEKAIEMKERFNLDCEVFASHEELLDAGLNLDVVHVCTPPYTHADIAINVMNKKINVVVEKPMATSLQECDEMLRVEKENNVLMASIAQNRFRTDMFCLKNVLESNKAGKLLCSHINSLWWRGHCYYDLWWRGTWEKEGGGPTLNHAVHHMDLLNWMKGELPIEVTAVLGNVAHDNSEVEDLSFAICKYKDNSIAEITSSVIHHGEEQALIMQCDNAKVSAPWSCNASLSMANGFPVKNQELEDELNKMQEDFEALPYEGHTGEIFDIYTSLEKGERPLITGIDGRNTVELITAVYKAGFARKTISLPIGNDDDYYTTAGILQNVKNFYEKTSSIENMTAGDITLGNLGK